MTLDAIGVGVELVGVRPMEPWPAPTQRVGDGQGQEARHLGVIPDRGRVVALQRTPARRTRGLVVLQPERVIVQLAAGGELELRNDVPATRAECPTTRPCGHVRCRYHTWLMLGSDRPGPHRDGRPLRSTLRAAWLETPTPPSCALDVAETVPAGETLLHRDVGRALGRGAEWARRLARRARRRLIEQAHRLPSGGATR